MSLALTDILDVLHSAFVPRIYLCSNRPNVSQFHAFNVLPSPSKLTVGPEMKYFLDNFENSISKTLMKQK